ncbi:MAG: hypothetical protein KF757_04580 [Phycisphaeraceae bacterium]|nr:hypothetical protein [Phycisphaeraceae bacterium]
MMSMILRVLSASCIAIAVPTSLAEDILHIHDDSLTAYLAGPTAVQGFQPTALQRAVNIDGTQRRPVPFGLMLAANPSDPGTMSTQVAGVEAATGEVFLYDTHIALPSHGVTWTVGITLNQMQGADVEGYQGRNWFQISQPELVFVGDPNDPEPDDMVYIVFGSSYVEYSRFDSSDVFRGVNGVAGAVEHVADGTSEPDLYILRDARGTKAVFFGFDGDAGNAEGQLWFIEDPAGNKAYVGDATTASTAITNGYDAEGRMVYAYDASGRRYHYEYDFVDRLESVTAAVKSGSNWLDPTTVARVDYNYYEEGDPVEELVHGNPGSLQEVTITTPLSGPDIVVTKHYRYWLNTESAVDDALKYIVDAEGVRTLEIIQTDPFTGEYLAAPDDLTFTKHVSHSYNYDTGRRVTSTWQNGECGCSGPANGIHAIAYSTNGGWSASTGYTSGWKHRTTVARPDGSYEIVYTDELGQVIARVISDADPGTASNFWVTGVERDAAGRVIEIRPPASSTGYTYSTNTFTWSTSAGLIRVFGRETSGNLTGLVRQTGWKIGTSGTTSLVSSQGYMYTHSSIDYGPPVLSVGDYDILRPMVRWNWTYADSNVTTAKAWNDATTTTASRTLMEYTFHSGDAALMPETLTTTMPPVSTGNNGSNSSNVVSEFRDEAGRRVWQKTASGKINYWKYVDGRLATQVQDADTGKPLFSGMTIPSGFDSDGSDDEFHRVTSYAGSDTPGGSSTGPDGHTSETFVTVLADRRIVRLGIPKKVAGSPDTYHGPVSYTVTNHAGQTEFSGSIVFSGGSTTGAPDTWIDDEEDEPFDAVLVGTLFAVSTNLYNETGGTLLESHTYHDLSTPPAYDSTFYLYDTMGRRVAVKDPTGTISHTTYDAIGRPSASFIGTNDHDHPGVPFAVEFETEGDSDMVMTSETIYDAGAAGGNSLVTKTTAFVQDSGTDKRETTYAYDARHRRILTVNPQAPHSVVKLDNLGRTLAVGLYTSSSGLSAATDPTSHTTSRTALSETFHDELGRTWRSRQHKITQSGEYTGDSADTLDADTWYDAEGRTAKHQGHQLTKTAYDRIGRATHSFVLAAVNDSSYADALTITGDIVVEQSQTAYASDISDLVLMSVAVSRLHDDYGSGETTGSLNTTAEALEVEAASLEGRASITAYWYDDRDRLVTTAHYGDNGGNDFDRDALSEPAYSDASRIVTKVVYADNGLQFESIDPAGIVTRTLYDDAGRTIASIANYTGGSTTSPVRDHDLYTRYTYQNGLQSTIWVDLNGDGDNDIGDDQVTRYIYGVRKGTDPHESRLSHNGLLRAVIYPDSTNEAEDATDIDTDDDDVVTYSYNAQGQPIRTRDQAGNVIETDYDTAGRETHRRATDVADDFDEIVLRISTTYLPRGLVEKVTQYNDASPGSGSVLDEVLYDYDDWGMVGSITQDHDSAVASGGTQYTVSYTYTKLAQSGGRRAVNLLSMTLPDSTVVLYECLSNAFGLGGDSKLGRVTRVKVGATYVAEYEYLGLNRVVRTELLQPEYYKTLAASSAYDRLDRFGRVTRDVWTADRTTDIDLVDFAITYDERSNITSVQDHVHPTMGHAYQMDDLSRLVDAQRGVVASGSITTPNWIEQWDLGVTGTWNGHRLDLDGDSDYSEPDEIDASNTFTLANAWLERDIAGKSKIDLAHDPVGNLTNDGQHYKYVYDPFGRLRMVLDQSDDLVAEYRYNGLNQRITAHFDTNGVDGVTGADVVSHFAYDSRWRIVARYEDTNSDPTEQFVFHNAGLASTGSGSYIDAVMLRDRDTTANGTLDERVYYLHNWRSDIVALISHAGSQIEQVRYEPYGTPFGIPAGDIDADGKVTQDDIDQATAWYSGSAYDVRADLDMNGSVNLSDITYIAGNKVLNHETGRGVLSLEHIASRKGYAGYESLAELEASGVKWDVRNRVLLSEIGSWNRRDPLGYVDGMNLYEYVMLMPIVHVDSDGQKCGTVWQRLACTGLVIAASAELTACMLLVASCVSGNLAACPAAVPVCCSAVASLLEALNYCRAKCSPNGPLFSPSANSIILTVLGICSKLSGWRSIVDLIRRGIPGVAVAMFYLDEEDDQHAFGGTFVTHVFAPRPLGPLHEN